MRKQESESSGVLRLRTHVVGTADRIVDRFNKKVSRPAVYLTGLLLGTLITAEIARQEFAPPPVDEIVHNTAGSTTGSLLDNATNQKIRLANGTHVQVSCLLPEGVLGIVEDGPYKNGTVAVAASDLRDAVQPSASPALNGLRTCVQPTNP